MLPLLHNEIITCRKCPRLVEWRERVAREKAARFRAWEYWGKPVPSFGPSDARLLVVGLAPGAHGANRTGRVFTGDKSGDWLYRALFKAGFASQPTSVSIDDGLELNDCRICAVVRCAPPDNKPEREETETCRPFFDRELELLPNVRVVVALGHFAFDNVLGAFQRIGTSIPSPKPKFGHGASFRIRDGLMLIGSYHPSQQNTSTKKLTEPMLDAVFEAARAAL